MATPRVNHFFVDESGDLTLFDAKGRIVVGNENVSKTFIVGFALIPNPEHVHLQLEKLRASLIADPYFKDVPSMQPGTKKTAVFFHAKDDVGEVRREVFHLLPQLGVKVQAAIRRKQTLAQFAKTYFTFHGEKLQPNTVYDDLIKRLFRNVLHRAEENRIIVARRGKSPRTEALERAIEKAKRNFAYKWGKKSDALTTIIPAYPSESAGLQVIDYYLWALQRMIEKREARFFDLLSKDFRLIMDLDDTRDKPYGEWYSDTNPLALEKLMPV
ncbi:MAG: DUF3800 domain-containing protein [Ignavibacteriae bacterium]|nr:DUF3800 domain-containing protein [Ignavibacteriota bacterium]